MDVGRAERINAELAKHATAGLTLPVIDAPDEVEMDEHPAQAVRRKPQASINVAMQAVKAGTAAAMVSAGNSGATMVAALFHLGRITGIDRPAIGAIMPTLTGDLLLIDAGANTEVHPQYLVQFAQMGSIYMRKVRGVERPRIGLLSSGEEETKGTKIVQETHQLLKATPDIQFIGNVEGKDLPKGACDVCVTDGFTGNVALKTAEGTAAFMGAILRRELTKSLPRKVCAAFLRPAFRAMRDELDPAREGGALLFGVDGVAVIAHGHSDSRAIRNAIRVAKECVAGEAVAAIRALHTSNEH
ncbi:MAG: phosphate acyltransferase PlsX [Thermomicrobia bacterium]|nr:phosphate acyltransferase PlsX [Thermomicrobia bacterium]